MKVIREQGMPSYRHHHHGNLYIQFDVQFPKHLGGNADGESMTEEQKKALESVLPPRMAGPTPPADAMTDDYQLEDIDPTREGARAAGNATAMDEDDEEGVHGERVQCASQ